MKEVGDKWMDDEWMNDEWMDDEEKEKKPVVISVCIADESVLFNAIILMPTTWKLTLVISVASTK